MTSCAGVAGSKIDGSTIEVVLAKPVDKQEYQRYTRSEQLKAVPGLAGVQPFVSSKSQPQTRITG